MAPKTGITSIAQLKAAAPLPRTIVDLSDLLGEGAEPVHLMAMTGAQREAIEKANVVDAPDGTAKVTRDLLRARTVALSLITPDGERMAKGRALEEVAREVNELPVPVLDRLFDEAQKLNGYGAKAQKALEGNSAPAPGDSSSSSSETSGDVRLVS